MEQCPCGLKRTAAGSDGVVVRCVDPALRFALVSLLLQWATAPSWPLSAPSCFWWLPSSITQPRPIAPTITTYPVSSFFSGFCICVSTKPIRLLLRQINTQMAMLKFSRGSLARLLSCSNPEGVSPRHLVSKTVYRLATPKRASLMSPGFAASPFDYLVNHLELHTFKPEFVLFFLSSSSTSFICTWHQPLHPGSSVLRDSI